jgi:beta-lactam-binding protein with PASTA domain
LPKDVGIVQFVPGTEPTEVCAEPSGPQNVEVPSVVGLAKEDAVTALEEWALPADVTTIVAPDVAPGTVIAQDPPPGTVVIQGTPVTISVAIAAPDTTVAIVPALIGVGVNEATTLLRAMGLIPIIVDQWQCNPPSLCSGQRDLVWYQDPEPGTQLAPGATVVIRVNRGDAGASPGHSPPPSPSPTPSPSPSGP